MATPWWEFWAVEMLMRIVVCAVAVAPRPNARPRPRAKRRNDLVEGRGNGRVDGMAVPVNLGGDESGPIAWAMQTRWRKPRPGRDYGGAAWPRASGFVPGARKSARNRFILCWNVAGACHSSTCCSRMGGEWVVLAVRRRAGPIDAVAMPEPKSPASLSARLAAARLANAVLAPGQGLDPLAAGMWPAVPGRPGTAHARVSSPSEATPAGARGQCSLQAAPRHQPPK